MKLRKILTGCVPLLVVIVWMAAALVGCTDSDDNGPTVHHGPRPTRTATPTATPTPLASAPGSGLFAIDCTNGRAYVPLPASPDPNTGNGRVAVLDITVDPNTTDPRIATIVLNHTDQPTGAALDPVDNLVLVVSGQSGAGGFVDVIDTTTSPPSLVAGSPFATPPGTEPGFFGQILFDPISNIAVMASFEDSAGGGCPTVGTCTGFMTFDPVAHTFGGVVPAPYPETFSLNSTTEQVIDASDDNSSGSTVLVDGTNKVACSLADSNIGADQDGASVDSSTNIVVISNEDGTATVLNLNGSTLTLGPPCSVNEGGTPPNSVLVSGLPGSTAGSAVNPVTHEAFLIEDGSNGVTVLTLPTSPIAQIASGNVTSVIATLPNDPQGTFWSTQGDPYAVAYDTCNDRGFAEDSSSLFLVRVDVPTMQSNAAGISTALPAGSCAGTTSTTFACDNGAGVTFFPLPGVL